MNVEKRLRRLFKFRFAILYPLGVFAVLFTIPDDNSIRVSIGFIVSGLLIRIWANGCAIKIEKLTTCGPYAFVRHPLYLGTMLLAVGFIIMLKIYSIGALFIIPMAIVYYHTIKKEEAMLETKFKEEYLTYKKKVPPIFPKIFPYHEGEKWSFSLRRLMQSQEYKLFFWVIILAISFHLKDEFIVEHETMDAKIWGLVIAAFIFGMLDFIGEFVKGESRLSKNKFRA